MLQQQRGGDGRVTRIGVEDGAMLGRRQKDLSRLPAGIVKEANASRVGEAPMLEVEYDVRAGSASGGAVGQHSLITSVVVGDEVQLTRPLFGFDERRH
jgi:hypothetical protein